MCIKHNQAADIQKSEQRSERISESIEGCTWRYNSGAIKQANRTAIEAENEWKRMDNRNEAKSHQQPMHNFLFANNDDKDEFNFQSLKKINSSENPVAIIRSINEGSCSAKNQQHFDETRNPQKNTSVLDAKCHSQE